MMTTTMIMMKMMVAFRGTIYSLPGNDENNSSIL